MTVLVVASLSLVACSQTANVPLNKELEAYFPKEASITMFHESQGVTIRQLASIEYRESSTVFNYTNTYFDHADLRRANRREYSSKYVVTGNRIVEYLSGDVPDFIPVLASTIYQRDDEKMTWTESTENIYGETVQVSTSIREYLNDSVIIVQTADAFKRQIVLEMHEGIVDETTNHTWSLSDVANERNIIKVEEDTVSEIVFLYSDSVHPLYDKLYFESVFAFDREYANYLNTGSREVFNYLAEESPVHVALDNFVYAGKRLDFVSIRIDRIVPLENGDVNVEVTENIIQTLSNGEEQSQTLQLVYTVRLENNNWLVYNYQPLKSDE